MTEPTQPGYRRRERREAAVPIWVLGFVAAVFVSTCLALWAFVVVTRPTVPLATASAVFVKLTQASAPTLDPLLSATSLPPLAESTSTVPPNVNPGTINLGSHVQVVRTDGDPLKLRQAPSISSEVNYLALPSEVLKVGNGPTIADGFTWWFLVDPADDTRNGWAVENYLDATNGP